MYYFETIAAIGLKVGLNIQINELIKLNENQRSRAKGITDFKIKSCFSQKLLSHLELNISYESLWVHGNENLYK